MISIKYSCKGRCRPLSEAATKAGSQAGRQAGWQAATRQAVQAQYESETVGKRAPYNGYQLNHREAGATYSLLVCSRRPPTGGWLLGEHCCLLLLQIWACSCWCFCFSWLVSYCIGTVCRSSQTSRGRRLSVGREM